MSILYKVGKYAVLWSQVKKKCALHTWKYCTLGPNFSPFMVVIHASFRFSSVGKQLNTFHIFLVHFYSQLRNNTTIRWRQYTFKMEGGKYLKKFFPSEDIYGMNEYI